MLILLYLVLAQPIHAPEIDHNHPLITFPQKNFPTTLEGWVSHLEDTYGEDKIQSNADFVHQGHSLGYRVELKVGGVDVTWWSGMHGNSHKGLPIRYSISGRDSLTAFGISSKLVGDIMQPYYAVAPGRYSVAVDCNGAGCLHIEVATEEGEVTRVVWDFPLD